MRPPQKEARENVQASFWTHQACLSSIIDLWIIRWEDTAIAAATYVDAAAERI